MERQQVVLRGVNARSYKIPDMMKLGGETRRGGEAVLDFSAVERIDAPDASS